MVNEVSSLAASVARDIAPNFSLGEGNTITGGTIIGGDLITHVHNIYPHAEPPDSAKARDALISEIAAWFNLKSNARAIHNDMKKKRIPETGNWFITSKEYKDWKDTKGAVLCATGIPGAGKTVLMSRVIDDLLPLEESADQKICILFIYNRYNETFSVGDILKSFILQILQRHSHLVDLVKPLYRRGLLENTSPSDDDLLRVLLKLEDHFDRTYCAIDGVDEVDRKNLVDLILVLEQLQGNVIFASRPLESLRTSLKNAVYLTLLAQDHDLRLLVDDRLRRYSGLCRILEKHNYREEAIRRITEKAAGMFLHAALQIEALRSCLSLVTIEAKLDQFPAGIEGMYAASISRIENQDPELVKIAKLTLFWLVFARRPLSLRDLQTALGVNPETHSVDKSLIPDEQAIIDLCCGLVELDAESAVVRLVHLTAKDALEPLLLKDFPQPHLFISKVLAQRMVDNNLPCCTITEPEQFTTLLSQEPLLDYSYRHWGTHVRECGDSPEAVDAALSFLQQCTSFPHTYWNRLDLMKPLHVAACYGLSTILDNMAFDDYGISHFPASPTSSSSSPQRCVQLSEPIRINDTTMLGWTALMVASYRNEVDFVKKLLRVPSIDINASKAGQVALEWASLLEQGKGDSHSGKGPGANDSAVDDGWTALMWASYIGDERLVNELLNSPGVDVNAASKTGWTALMLASRHGHSRTVRRLLQAHGINVNAVSDKGWTALMLAAENGHDVVVSQLLQVHGINVNAATSDGWTALMYASQRGRNGVVAQLLRCHGIAINAAISNGWTALMLASGYGHDGVVRQLLQMHGVDVNATANTGWTALMYALQKGYGGVVQQLLRFHGTKVNVLASQNGHEVVVKQLLQFNGIDANSANNNGCTALMYASHNGHEEVVSLLLQFPGIDVNSVTNEGWTALMYASQKGGDGVVKQLAQFDGVSVNNANSNGWTALMLASVNCHEGAVAQLLQFDDIAVNALSKTGWTALMYASQKGCVDVVERLLRFHDIDVNAAVNGWTALTLASKNGHDGVVGQLLKFHGVDVNAATNSGETALMHASYNGHDLVVSELLQFHGVDVNAANNNGWTALMHASYNGHDRVVGQLLGFPGIDVNAATNGWTALMLASQRGHDEVTKQLVQFRGVDVNANNESHDRDLKL
ncbi:ankyrin repeat domain-containing protein 50 [Coprinopsis cinerea AmutBmut pab1-1]|nr:ankyrin repeat domain-containing protein 50 [Coprinopsis cinerea AmutBmut pab1-1]